MVERLTVQQAAAYRTLMLTAYASAPDAFTSTAAERTAMPMAWWKARVSGGPLGRGGVWGAFLQGALVGAAGLSVERREKTRHKATLFGMYVAPDARSRGMGRQLVEAVIREATALDGVEVLQLTVTDGNESARRLYASCGFEPFGAEPMAMRTSEGFVAKVHLWRRVSADPG